MLLKDTSHMLTFETTCPERMTGARQEQPMQISLPMAFTALFQEIQKIALKKMYGFRAVCHYQHATILSSRKHRIQFIIIMMMRYYFLILYIFIYIMCR